MEADRKEQTGTSPIKRILHAIRELIYPKYREDAMPMPDFARRKIMFYLGGAGLCILAALWFLFLSYASWVVFLLGIPIFLLKAVSLRNGFAKNRIVVMKGFIKTVSAGGRLKPFQTIQVYTKPGKMAAEIAIDKKIQLAERGQYAFYFLRDSANLNRAVYTGSAGNFVGYEPIMVKEAKARE